MRFLRTFEGFSREELDKLILNKESFVKKINRKDKLIKDDLFHEIKNYDFSKFKYNKSFIGYVIYTDSNFINLCNKYTETQNNISEFDIEISNFENLNRFNLIEVYGLVPKELQGLSIGYKLYKFVLNLLGYLSTNKDNSDSAKNLWYNLLQDDDIYAGTNNTYSIIINKNQSISKIMGIVDKVKHLNFIYDDNLIKIIEDDKGRNY